MIAVAGVNGSEVDHGGENLKRSAWVVERRTKGKEGIGSKTVTG